VECHYYPVAEKQDGSKSAVQYYFYNFCKMCLKEQDETCHVSSGAQTPNLLFLDQSL